MQFFLKLAKNTGYCCHIIFLPLNCVYYWNYLFIVIKSPYWLTDSLTDPMSDSPQTYTGIKSSWSPTTRINSKWKTGVKLNTQHLHSMYCTKILLSSYSFSALCTIYITSSQNPVGQRCLLMWTQINITWLHLTSLYN